MSQFKAKSSYKWQIYWPYLTFHIINHLLAIYGFYTMIVGSSLWPTIVFTCYMEYLSNIGVIVGSHRYWTHHSFKAKWPLRILLATLQTLSFTYSIFNWCRDHKLHHKYVDTDADPHNSRRGFFFSHFGWILCKKHPEILEKGKQIYVKDLLSDPIVVYQRKYYLPLVILIHGIIPTVIPIYFWKETLINSFTANVFRHVCSLHSTCLVNSLAHEYGFKPYDNTMYSTENKLVGYFIVGEGYHNYHHSIDWDYSASEHSWQKNFNPATLFIDFFATIGWAYDRRKADIDFIEKRRQKTGDLSVDPKQKFVIIDWILGLTVHTWIIWVPFLTRFSINVL